MSAEVAYWGGAQLILDGDGFRDLSYPVYPIPRIRRVPCWERTQGDRRNRPYAVGDARETFRTKRPSAPLERVRAGANGIIENYQPLKQQLENEGYAFHSETDTEVVAHLIDKYLQQGMKLAQAVRAATKDVRGSYALAVISEREPGTILRRAPDVHWSLATPLGRPLSHPT